MIHILELITVCLSTPNRNCYLGQTAVLILIEADISFVYGFHSSAFFRVKSPLLATADIQLWRCYTSFLCYLCRVTCVCTVVGYSWGAAFQMELLFCSCGLWLQRLLLPAPAFGPPAAAALSWLSPSRLFSPTGMILPPGLSLAAASSAVSRLSAGLFPNPDALGSCLLLPDECQLWRGAPTHA